METAILLLSCPDSRGIVAKISNFLYQNNGNIVHADQHIDSESNTLFMRIEWALGGFSLAKEDIAGAFEPLAGEFKMKWQLYFSGNTPRVAIFVSQHLHCLYDLLLRYRGGQFNCEIPLIVSNHSDAHQVAQNFNISLCEFPILKENKIEQEKKQIELLRKEKIDVIILARYAQIFTKQFVDTFPNKVINIHHSFLPAFIGQAPYRQAYTRGVKIIGATSHYVTEELDAGPIIEQDTVRVSHRDSLEDLRRKGEDLERMVLSRAVKWHLERKILVYNNKTVVFD
ncbi:MAG: formyltetrahydrofolate deformylase [Candidatus Omnitrophica bacterium]|nr:formyltetrahydrofolate deformylase [Candidatus Omnitrophota bacterium]